MLELGFDHRALGRVWMSAIGTLVAGLVVIVVDLGGGAAVIPTWLRVPAGVTAIALGLWLSYGAWERGRSDDPAIRVAGDRLLLHVNPGRHVVLRRDEVSSVDAVRPVSWPARSVVGSEVLRIATTRRAWLWSSSIVVGSRFVVGDLDRIRDDLVAELG